MNPLDMLPIAVLRARTHDGKYVNVLVDGDYDREYFGQYEWVLLKSGYVKTTMYDYEYPKIGGYNRTSNSKLVYLHHLILPKKKGMWVRHINGNKLDNRSRNLEYMTPKWSANNRKVSTRTTNPKPRCKWGHKYTEENTYYPPDGSHQKRQCRQCSRRREKEYRLRKLRSQHES